VFRFVQFRNGLETIDVSEAGRLIVVRLVQPWNASAPMEVTLGRFTVVRAVKPENALPSMLVTSGSLIVFRDVLPENVLPENILPPMPVTISGRVRAIMDALMVLALEGKFIQSVRIRSMYLPDALVVRALEIADQPFVLSERSTHILIGVGLEELVEALASAVVNSATLKFPLFLVTVTVYGTSLPSSRLTV
jgi:hypothetical protein